MYNKLVEFPIIRLNKYVKNGDTRQDIIDSIVEGFDPDRFKPIFVGELPNGEYWIYDGHHRTCAAETLGQDVIKGYLKKISSMAEIADHYLMGNIDRPKTQYEKYHSYVQRGDANYVRISDAVKNYGFSIGPGRKDYNIAALKTVVDIEETFGIDIFQLVLECSRRSFDGHKDSLQKPVLLGLAYFLYHAKDKNGFNLDRFIRTLKAQKISELLAELSKKGEKPEDLGLKKFLTIHNFRLSHKLELNVTIA